MGGWRRETIRLRGSNRRAGRTGQVMESRRLLEGVGQREVRVSRIERKRIRCEPSMPLKGILERCSEVVSRRRQSAASAKRRTAVAHTSDPTVTGPFEQFEETLGGTLEAAKPGACRSRFLAVTHCGTACPSIRVVGCWPSRLMECWSVAGNRSWCNSANR